MIFRTQMQKAKILTIENGLFQVQQNGVVYQEYNPQFRDITFAGDAKHIFLALKTLATSYKVSKQDDKLYIYDTEQEFLITEEIPDIILEQEVTGEVSPLKSLIKLKVYATQDFPGFFFCKDYIEVLHPSMVVRVPNPYNVEGVFSIGDLPTTDAIFDKKDNGLWILLAQYSNVGFHPTACLGNLDLDKPDTDSYFPEDTSYVWSKIPSKIKDRWVPCDTAYFHKGVLRLGTQTVIEDVEGSGTYDGKLLAKVIRHADSWCFDGPLLRFTNGLVHGVHGVLENVEA